MKLGPNAINQMYPHLTGTKCDEHGDQSRAKVPPHLQAVFASREDPNWACSSCVSSAKEQWATHQSDLRRSKVEAQKAYRATIKEARESARNADRALVGYVSKCKNAVDAVKTAEVDLGHTRLKIASARNKAEGARQRAEKAQRAYEAHEGAFLQLSELSLEQFEALERADSDVGVCYNELRDRLTEANTLWDDLGKSAKKKRDKILKKAAMVVLKEYESVDEQVGSNIRRSSEHPEEEQRAGE